jgi:Mn2+/Fe2+ NRAMP family transporter
LAILEYETFDFFPIFALWGAGVGAGVGLVLGITVVLGGVARSKHQGYWRLLIAAMAAALLFATIWALGGNPTSWSSLILAVPAGIAAWLLLPMVLRPQAREPLPPLGT